MNLYFHIVCMYTKHLAHTERVVCRPTYQRLLQLHTTTTHDNYTMVQGAPISETEYEYIIRHIIRTNPFVSGNNSGFGFGTPNVPGYLSLVEVDVVAEAGHPLSVTKRKAADVVAEAGHPLSVTKRKAADVYDTDLRVYGSHCSHHNLLHKKFKSA